MYLRSFAVSIALALGLLVILGLAFIMCVPAYCLNLVTFGQPRTRALRSTTA
jgi:hypothetical protein